MMKITVKEMQNHLGEILESVTEGSRILIASEDGQIIAELTPVSKPVQKRVLGSEKGKITIHDDFLEPLPADILEGFNP